MHKEPKTQASRLARPVKIADQVWPDGTVPVLSIWCITFNHAKFIRDAIEGFLLQETTFPVEIFIHDDASFDGTAQIIMEYAVKHPKLFWAVFQKENQWSRGNRKILFDYLARQRGQFVAFCEGDDYWTSPHKLLKQVEYLSSVTTASGCFHRSVTVDEQGREMPDYFSEAREYAPSYSQRACVGLMSSYHTGSLVYRRDAYPFWLMEQTAHIACDYVMDLLITESGSLDYINFTGSAYRKHGAGIWQGVDEKERNLDQIKRLSVLWRDSHFGPKYRAEFQWLAQMFFRRYQESLIKNGYSVTQRLRIYSNDLRGVPFTWWSKLAFRFEGGLVKRRLRKADVAA